MNDISDRRGCTGHFEQSFVACTGIRLFFFSFFRLTHKGVILFSASSRADGGLATPQIHRSTSGAGTWAFFSALLHDGEDKKRDDSDGKGASQSCVRQEALEPVRVERKRGTRGPRKFSARGATEPENHFRFATR